MKSLYLSKIEVQLSWISIKHSELSLIIKETNLFIVLYFVLISSLAILQRLKQINIIAIKLPLKLIGTLKISFKLCRN